MSCRKIFMLFFLLLIIAESYYVYKLNNDNIRLSELILEEEREIIDHNMEVETFVSKKKELDKLIKDNKSKMSKYEEVEKWNQEVELYLD